MTLRNKIPTRSNVKPRKNYRCFRINLENDFNLRCGYCDDSAELVDPITFHIDHFAPKKKFPELINDYNNLVFSCRFCNVSKSNKWIGEKAAEPNDGESGFVDPCSEKYDNHLERSPEGMIIPKSKIGEYMIENLKLHLNRHKYLWIARRLRKLRLEVEELKLELENSEHYNLIDERKLLLTFMKLVLEIERYEGLVWNRNE